MAELSKSGKQLLLELDGESLTLAQLVKAARHLNVRIHLSPDSILRMKESRAWVDKIQKEGHPVVYGVNTGFGSKAGVSINKEKLRELQYNLIKSHSAGVGEPLPADIVRAAMILRANTLARGYSGICIEVVELLLKMLERGIVPWIPAQGSVGASGDLAPLSHLALVLAANPVSEDEDWGQAYWVNPDTGSMELLPARAAMAKAGLKQIVLEAKDGLALNNGTQISTAILAVTLFDSLSTIKLADVAMAMSFEALMGITSAMRPEVHQLRPHPGQISTAENIRRLTAGSKLLDLKPEKIQDAYSLRCHPQVIGSVRDTFNYIDSILAIEINSTNDNPIIYPELPGENKAISGGNFHAQSIALAADFLSIALCSIGNISERRIFRLSDKSLNEGLPSFLIAQDGLESGLMLAQYTAAALTSENKSLAHPASTDTIPTCENQEDHVSMSPVSARKTQWILRNVQKIVAIEFLYAVQALDLRLEKTGHSPADARKMLGDGTFAAYQEIRKEISFMDSDRPVYRDIEKMVDLMTSGRLLKQVEDKIGKLK